MNTNSDRFYLAGNIVATIYNFCDMISSKPSITLHRGKESAQQQLIMAMWGIG
jgi:hypothetical protein